MRTFEHKGIKIEWFGHASFKISNKLKIYIDPFVLPPTPEKADIILITHEHYDHCAVDNIKKLATEETEIVATEDCISKLKEFKIIGVKPDQEVEVKGIKIKTIPAYNINKTFHTKASNWVGYIIEIDGIRIYHAGDTDFIPEMEKLEDIEIALVPVGGKYTMDAREAAKAVNAFRPKIAIPMHWGSIIGSREDAETFKKLVEKSEVVILG